MSSRPLLLEVRDLQVSYPTRAGDVRAVSGITFSVGRGERVGLVGESGSGKTATALALTGLLPDSVRTSGSIRLASPSASRTASISDSVSPLTSANSRSG